VFDSKSGERIEADAAAFRHCTATA